MAREDPQLKLRLTEEMKAAITEAARLNGRSVNAEIVSRLEASKENAQIQDLIEALRETATTSILLRAAFSNSMRSVAELLQTKPADEVLPLVLKFIERLDESAHVEKLDDRPIEKV